MRLLSLTLIASTFGIAGWALAASLSGNQPHAPLNWLSLSAGLGAIAATFVIWPRLHGEHESLWLSTVSGLLIGIISHPIGAFIAVSLLSFGAVQFNQFDFNNDSLWDALLVAFVGTLLSSLCSLIGIGWISAGIGVAVGLLIGVTDRAWNWFVEKSAPTDTPRSDSFPSSAALPSLISLAIVATVSIWIVQRTVSLVDIQGSLEMPAAEVDFVEPIGEVPPAHD